MAQETSPKPVTQSDNNEWLLIGRVTGAHGLNGHVKVLPESDFPERFVEPGDRWLKRPGQKPTQVRITSGRFVEGKNHYLVKFAGVDYRDQAEDLRRAELLVPAGDRLPLEPGEFHVEDLIGLSVITQSDQQPIGTITDVFTTGHDLLEVTLSTSQPEASAVANTAEGAPETAKAAPHPSTRTKAAQKLRRKAKRKGKKKRPKTLLIPFVEEIVPVVDIASGRIEITPPAGLIELA